MLNNIYDGSHVESRAVLWVTEIKQSPKKHPRRQMELAANIHVFSYDNGRIISYTDNLSTKKLAD